MSAARGLIADWVLLAGFCLLFAAQVILSVGQKSATFDEPANLVSGYVAQRYGDYWLMPESLPLVKLLAAAPLLFSSVRVPPAPEPGNGDAARRFFDRFLYEANDGDTLLMLGRAAVLPRTPR